MKNVIFILFMSIMVLLVINAYVGLTLTIIDMMKDRKSNRITSKNN